MFWPRTGAKPPDTACSALLLHQNRRSGKPMNYRLPGIAQQLLCIDPSIPDIRHNSIARNSDANNPHAHSKSGIVSQGDQPHADTAGALCPFLLRQTDLPLSHSSQQMPSRSSQHLGCPDRHAGSDKPDTDPVPLRRTWDHPTNQHVSHICQQAARRQEGVSRMSISSS